MGHNITRNLHNTHSALSPSLHFELFTYAAPVPVTCKLILLRMLGDGTLNDPQSKKSKLAS